MIFSLPKSCVITLDGLAASGKSSVAKGIASALAIPYISSGLLYRLVALAALEASTDVKLEAAVLAVIRTHELCFEARVPSNLVWLDGIDVTALCHSTRVDLAVSVVAQHPQVRAWVNTQIRLLEPPFIAEGRDMGAVVFPDAAVKLFLTASSQVRALRRVAERSRSLEEVQKSIEARDAMDAINTQPAKDAIHIDSSNLNLEQTVQHALELIRGKLGGVL